MTKKLLLYFAIIAGIAPIVLFGLYVLRYTINIPFLDDSLYYTDCLLKVNQSKSGLEAFWVFMKQHTITEHRTPISKWVAWLIYQCTGKLNYVILAHLGNLFLVAQAAFFWNFFKKQKWSWIYWLPIPYLLFQMQTYENQFWTICNWTYYPITFLQMVSLYYLSYQGKRHFFWAIVFAVLATFTFSNGMFVFLPALLVLLYQRRYMQAGTFTAIGVACILLYFSNYKPSPIAPHEFSLEKLLKSFVILLGDYIDLQGYHQYAYWVCGTLGFVLVLLGIVASLRVLLTYFQTTSKQYDTSQATQLFLVSAFVCVLMSGAAVAYSRYTGENAFEEMFNSRYKFISVILLCLAYCYCLWLFEADGIRKIVFAVFLPATIFLFAYSYYWNHEFNVNFRERLVTALFNFKKHQSWTLYPFDNDWTKQIDDVTTNAINTGVYALPEMITTSTSISMDTTAKASNALKVEDKDYYYLLTNEDAVVNNPVDVYNGLILQSDKDVYLVPIKRKRNKSRRDFLFHQNYFGKGFEVELLKNTYHPAIYHIGLVTIKDGVSTVKYLQKMNIQ